MASDSPPSPSPSQLPPIPTSPTYSYASTANPLSQYHLPLPPPPRPAHAVLTRADLDASQTAYADLISSAKGYRLALASLSTAASTFGSALESCARLKEARADALGPAGLGPAMGGSMSNSFHATRGGPCTADTLLTVAGLQHLVANHQQILSETVYRAFEVPLLHELDKWRAAIEDEEERYVRTAQTQGREIRRLEKEGLKLQRQRRRDVGLLRGHLVELTTKLDSLTTLHGEHARALLRESQDTSARIVDASCSLVRAEVDIFESLARKGWTGGGLEDVLEKGTDLFAADDAAHHGAGAHGGGGTGSGAAGSGGTGGTGEGSKLFSILPPRSILADSASDNMRPSGGHARHDSLRVDTDRYQSLTGAVSEPVGRERERERDTDSVFSEFNRSRGVRPFSPQPQPLRLNPDDLLVGLEEDVMSEAEEERQALLSSSSETAKERHESPDAAELETVTLEEPEKSTIEPDTEDDDHPWRDEGLVRVPARRDAEEDKDDGETSLSGQGDGEHRHTGWSSQDEEEGA